MSATLRAPAAMPRPGAADEPGSADGRGAADGPGGDEPYRVAAAEPEPVQLPAADQVLGARATDMSPAAEAALQWTFNPWRQDLRNALVGAIAAAAVTTLVAGLGLPPLAIAALALVFLAAVHPAFLPTRCRVDDEGVARRFAFGWERRRWEAIHRASLGRRGLFVSPGLRPGPLESFRGLWLPIPPTAAPALLDELRGRLKQHGL